MCKTELVAFEGYSVTIPAPTCPCCGEELSRIKVKDINLADLTYLVIGDCDNDNGCSHQQWLEVEINR